MKAFKIAAALAIVGLLCLGAAITLVAIPEEFNINIFQAHKIGIKLMLLGTILFPLGSLLLFLSIPAKKKP